MDLFKYFMRESFRPGFMREYDKLEKAVRGAGDLTIGDISARQAGYRVNSLTIPESARYRIAKEATNIRESTKRYNSAINPNRELSPQQIEAEYQRSNSDRQEAIGRVRRHNQNLATLGYNESQRIAILKDSGLSSRDVLSVMTGIDINLRRDRKITSSILWDEQLAGKSRDEQMASIRAIAKDDPSMGRKLMNRMRSEEKQRRSGVSDLDALILNLDPDGERAMFLSNMVDKRSPNAKIREWQRKGLVTPEIAQQILLLLQ
jgi:hypothetical protein